jgi:hypothetical protein
MSIRLASVAALVALLSGCPADHGNSNTPAPPELVPAFEAVCDLIARCPGDLPPIASRSRAECADIVYWATTCRLDDSGVTRTPLDLDAASAQACADFLAGLACDELSCLSDGTCPEGAACARLFGGLGEDSGSDDVSGPGERCYRYGSPGCDDAHFCAPEAYDAVNHVMLCEVCVPRLTMGAECDASAPSPECASPLVCVRDTTTGQGHCEPIRAAGQPCSSETECATGFCGNNTCLEDGHEGDPCTENYECRWMESLTCVLGACGPLHGPGEPCGEPYDCVGSNCHTDGLCGLPNGERCDGSADCRTGYCPSFTACMPRLPNGDPCTYDDMCTGGLCDTSSGTCATAPPPQPVGGSCSDTTDCEDGLQCDGVCYEPCDGSCPAGTICIYTGSHEECLPPQPDGAHCEGDDDCASGYCNDDSEICGQPLEIGDACSGFGDCYPLGYCQDGVCVARHGPDAACTGYDSCLHPYVCMSNRCTLISLSCEPAPIGQQCTYLRFCAADGYCDFSSFTCVPRHGPGESCGRLLTGEGDDCAPGLTCAVDETSGSSICRPRVAAGAACTAGDVCLPCGDVHTEPRRRCV